jgi:hypothetical protein
VALVAPLRRCAGRFAPRVVDLSAFVLSIALDVASTVLLATFLVLRMRSESRYTASPAMS